MNARGKLAALSVSLLAATGLAVGLGGDRAEAAATHTLSAYQPGYSSGETELLTTVGGEGGRYVIAKVTAWGIGPKRLLVDIRMHCGETQWTRASQNVSATMSAILYVRLVTTAPECAVYGRAATMDATPDDAVKVTTEVFQVPAAGSSTAQDNYAWPTVLPYATPTDKLPVVRNAGGYGYLNVFGDAKLTSCHQKGGSRENGSGYLCTDELLTLPDHIITVRLIVSQLAVGGGYCRSEVLAERVLTISALEHHKMVYLSGIYYTDNVDPDCTREVRAKLWFYGNAGNSIIHAAGTQVTIWR